MSAFVSSCHDASPPTDAAQHAFAVSFLDSFYAWDASGLEDRLGVAEGAAAIRYYQGWAEAAHYEIVERRPCIQRSSTRVECAVTVDDDFGAALGYQATDTFAFEFDGDQLVAVSFEGDDPIAFWMMLAWMAFDRGEVFDTECAGIFADGPTPRECARAVAAAARAFATH